MPEAALLPHQACHILDLLILVGESRFLISRIELPTVRSSLGHKLQEANIFARTVSMKKHSNGGLPITPRSTELLKVILDG